MKKLQTLYPWPLCAMLAGLLSACGGAGAAGTPAYHPQPFPDHPTSPAHPESPDSRWAIMLKRDPDTPTALRWFYAGEWALTVGADGVRLVLFDNDSMHGGGAEPTVLVGRLVSAGRAVLEPAMIHFNNSGTTPYTVEFPGGDLTFPLDHSTFSIMSRGEGIWSGFYDGELTGFLKLYTVVPGPSTDSPPSTRRTCSGGVVCGYYGGL